MKVDIRLIKKNAIEEYTTIIKTIATLQNKNSGSTGFLATLEEDVKSILLDFIHPKHGIDI